MSTDGVSGGPITQALILVSEPITNMDFVRQLPDQLAVFKARATSISGSIRKERATRKN